MYMRDFHYFLVYFLYFVGQFRADRTLEGYNAFINSKKANTILFSLVHFSFYKLYTCMTLISSKLLLILLKYLLMLNKFFITAFILSNLIYIQCSELIKMASYLQYLNLK